MQLSVKKHDLFISKCDKEIVKGDTMATVAQKLFCYQVIQNTSSKQTAAVTPVS